MHVEGESPVRDRSVATAASCTAFLLTLIVPDWIEVVRIDPDRQVAPNYVAFVIETKDDQTVLGIITSDTPASIIVRGAYGKEVVIPRDRIKRMISSKKSMMPEGLETGLSQQDLADLLEFISAVR